MLYQELDALSKKVAAQVETADPKDRADWTKVLHTLQETADLLSCLEIK